MFFDLASPLRGGGNNFLAMCGILNLELPIRAFGFRMTILGIRKDQGFPGLFFLLWILILVFGALNIEPSLYRNAMLV